MHDGEKGKVICAELLAPVRGLDAEVDAGRVNARRLAVTERLELAARRVD